MCPLSAQKWILLLEPRSLRAFVVDLLSFSTACQCSAKELGLSTRLVLKMMNGKFKFLPVQPVFLAGHFKQLFYSPRQLTFCFHPLTKPAFVQFSSAKIPEAAKNL